MDLPPCWKLCRSLVLRDMSKRGLVLVKDTLPRSTADSILLHSALHYLHRPLNTPWYWHNGWEGDWKKNRVLSLIATEALPTSLRKLQKKEVVPFLFAEVGKKTAVVKKKLKRVVHTRLFPPSSVTCSWTRWGKSASVSIVMVLS